MVKLVEHNENLETPPYLPSRLGRLNEKHEYFEVPYLETTITRHNNPHHWLQQDIAQNIQFQYRFFQNIILNEDTIRQIKVFSHFLLKYFRFNYQLIREQQAQGAYINFPRLSTETELLKFISKSTKKYVHCRDLLSFNLTYFELINYDTNFIIEHFQTSDNRPYTNPNFISEHLLDEHSPHTLQHDTGHKISHTNRNETTEFFQNQETIHFNNIPDPSETASIQNVSEFSEEATNNPQSIKITDDSNIIQISVQNITQTHINDQSSKDTPHNPNQDNTSSTVSTSTTPTTQELQPQQQTIHPNYDPPPPPSQFSPLTTEKHNSHQQGSSNTQLTNTVQFQTISPTSQPEVPTLANTPDQTTQTQNMQPALTINTLQPNPLPNYTTCRHLSRHPLQIIPTNPLSYGLFSTNPNNTQPTITNNNLSNTLNPSSTSHQQNTS